MADTALNEHAGMAQFVTGQIARIDLNTGTALHRQRRPPAAAAPARRRRRRAPAARPTRRSAPCPNATFHVQTLPLEPGDRLMFLTDGVLERDAAKVDVRAMLAASRERSPAPGRCST